MIFLGGFGGFLLILIIGGFIFAVPLSIILTIIAGGVDVLKGNNQQFYTQMIDKKRLMRVLDSDSRRIFVHFEYHITPDKQPIEANYFVYGYNNIYCLKNGRILNEHVLDWYEWENSTEKWQKLNDHDRPTYTEFRKY